MKRNKNEKTTLTTVLAVLAIVGVGALMGICLNLHKETPQEVLAEETPTEEEMVVAVVEDTATEPDDISETGGGEPVINVNDEVVIPAEKPETLPEEGEKKQSIQPDPVQTEDKKPTEKPKSVREKEESKPKEKPENEKIPAGEEEDKDSGKDTNKDKSGSDKDKGGNHSGNSGGGSQGEVKNGRIYIEGFGWVEYEGGGTDGKDADEIYENGNKVGIM